MPKPKLPTGQKKQQVKMGIQEKVFDVIPVTECKKIGELAVNMQYAKITAEVSNTLQSTSLNNFSGSENQEKR